MSERMAASEPAFRAFTEKELAALRNEVYKGYQNKPRNYGREAMEYREYEEDPTDFYEMPRDEIDFARYRSGYATPPELMIDNAVDEAARTADLFGRVSDELGIDRVDTEPELRQVFDYVLGARAVQPDTPVVVVPREVPLPVPEPATREYEFGDPDRPGAFAGSYYDFLGGDPSDPGNFYNANLLGDNARGEQGIMRSVFDNRTVRPVPVGRDSFISPLGQMEVPDDQRDEFLNAALSQLGMIEPDVFEGGNEGMVNNEATRALNELTRGFYS